MKANLSTLGLGALICLVAIWLYWIRSRSSRRGRFAVISVRDELARLRQKKALHASFLDPGSPDGSHHSHGDGADCGSESDGGHH
jgi:hypothetical protein